MFLLKLVVSCLIAVGSIDGCPPNEQFTLEKPSCPPESCFAIRARFDCTTFPPPAPGCVCKPGFRRLKDSDSPCVPMCQCPELSNSPECLAEVEVIPVKSCPRPDEEYVLDKRSCPPGECWALSARLDCRNAPPPAPGCVCKSGMRLTDATSPCVPICDCPQMKYSPLCSFTLIDEDE